MSRLHGSNVLRLRLMHCLCYPDFSLANTASIPNAASTMLIWWSIFTLRQYQASEKVSFHFSSATYLFLSYFVIYRFFTRRRCIDKLGIYHANQTSICSDPHVK